MTEKELFKTIDLCESCGIDASSALLIAAILDDKIDVNSLPQRPTGAVSFDKDYKKV